MVGHTRCPRHERALHESTTCGRSVPLSEGAATRTRQLADGQIRTTHLNYRTAMVSVLRVVASFHPHNQPLMPWSRFNNLIDGVFGFSLTVLMLRLAAPVYAEGQLGAALMEQAPYYLLYCVGFLQIIGAWSVLRRLSSWTKGIDFYGVLFALLALMMWATLPFTLDILMSALGNRNDEASAARLMSLTLLVGMVGLTGLFLRLERRGCFRADLDPHQFAVVRLTVYTVVAWPVAVFVLSYVTVWASLGVYLGAVLLSLLPLEAMTTEQYAATA